MIRARTSPAPQHTSFQIHNGSFPLQVTQDELEKPKENFGVALGVESAGWTVLESGVAFIVDRVG